VVRLGDKRALPHLKTLLEDRDDSIREIARHAIKLINKANEQR